MTKKILLCFDGTGNNNNIDDYISLLPDRPSDITNVLRLHLLAGGSLRPDEEPRVDGQVSLYSCGPASRTNEVCCDKQSSLAQRLLGVPNFGFFCGRIGVQINEMRKKLTEVYAPGDVLYMIGFSRGSSACREFAMELSKKGVKLIDGKYDKKPTIEFMGCFDTVSSQYARHFFPILHMMFTKGIPSPKLLTEQDGVSPLVKKALHLVSLDDANDGTVFCPTLMSQSQDDEGRVHEIWLPGGHLDVGGGGVPESRNFSMCHQGIMKKWLEKGGLKFLTPAQVLSDEEQIMDVDSETLLAKEQLDSEANVNGISAVGNRPPTHRRLYTLVNNERVNGVVKVHVSCYERFEGATPEKPYYYNATFLNKYAYATKTTDNTNINLTSENVVVVDDFGNELAPKTALLKKLLDERAANLNETKTNDT